MTEQTELGLLTISQFVRAGYTTDDVYKTLLKRTCQGCKTKNLIRNPKDSFATKCTKCLTKIFQHSQKSFFTK